MDTETAQTVEHMTLDMLEAGSEARIVSVGAFLCSEGRAELPP